MLDLRPLGLAAVIAAAALPSFAQQFSAGDITVEKPWSRATPKGASVAAGYMVIHNRGSKPDKLVGGSADFAAAVQIHEMKTTDGVMQMRQLTAGVDIPAGGTVTFAPSAYHLMFTGLKQPLKQGEKVKATLDFEHAGKLPVEFAVGGIGAAGPDHAKPAKTPMGGMKMD